MLRSPLNRSGSLSPKRTRKCAVKGCANRFQPRNMSHKVCGAECAAVHAVAERKRLAAKLARADRVATKAALEKYKRKPEWIAEVQDIFNKIVRFEDRDLPCISCGQFVVDDGRPGGVWDAGHYLARGGNAHLRFDRRNVHKQCKSCNRPGGTTRQAFRNGMIARIGRAELEALEADQAPRHYTIDDLKQMKAELATKLRTLKEQA